MLSQYACCCMSGPAANQGSLLSNNYYRLWSKGDNTFGSVHLSIGSSICLSPLSCLYRALSDSFVHSLPDTLTHLKQWLKWRKYFKHFLYFPTHKLPFPKIHEIFLFYSISCTALPESSLLNWKIFLPIFLKLCQAASLLQYSSYTPGQPFITAQIQHENLWANKQFSQRLLYSNMKRSDSLS